MQTEQAIIARLSVLERKVDDLLRRMGMGAADISDRSLETACEVSAATMDFTAIKTALSERIKSRRRKDAAA